MELTVAGLALMLAFSLCANVWLFARRKSAENGLRALQEAAKKAADEPTYDCRRLLHDLTAGAAAVKITRIDPTEIYIRRT